MNTQKNPYIGPRTFQRNEGHLFFGREREARDLISLVASERLVVFYAQSGAGKSSIVNTRLIPNLEEKEYEVLPVGRVSGDSGEGLDVNNIYVYNLLRSLEQHEVDPSTLAKLSLAQFLCQLNYDDKGFFYDRTLPDSIPASDDETIIRRALIIDQFEELFSTHPEAWEKRENFFQQVSQAMQDDPHLWIVLVMREDYIAALDPYAHLVSNGLRVRYYMQRLGREAGLKAVKSPVEGIRPYAEGVAEKLIDDLCSIKVQQPDGTLDVQPGQYVEPVQMQVVCYGLWDLLSPTGTQITEQDLQDVGDVNQSLGKYYDRRVSEVAKARNVRERMIREWFEKKLITAGGIRNMVLQEREPKPGELSDNVIRALQSDLVRGEKRGGATWYELTHDRLVEPILERNKVWFSENLSPLQRQAALWKDQDQNESWLLRDQALIEIEEWAKSHQDELTETENEFLAACQKLQAQIDERHAAERNRLEMAQKIAEEQARSAKRARIFNIVSAVLIVIALITTLASIKLANDAESEKLNADNAAIVAQQERDNAKEQSNIAHSGELSIAALERANSQLDLAILLGVKADSFKRTAQSQKTLLALLQKSGRLVGAMDQEEDIRQIQYAPDGKTFASLDKNGITLWDTTTRRPLNTEPIIGHYRVLTALALSNDGTLLASGASDGTIMLWDAGTREKLSTQPFRTTNNTITSLAVGASADGNTRILASASSNISSIILWDVTDPENPRQVVTLPGKDTGNPVKLAFSPDGTKLASGSDDGTVVVWDLASRASISDPKAERHTYVSGLTFNSKGTTLISVGHDSNVFLWDINRLDQPPVEFAIEGGMSISSMAIGPDDQTLAIALSDGSMTLWKITNPNGPAMIGESFNKNTDASISDMAFNPAGDLLASSSSNGDILFWDLTGRAEPQQSGVARAGNYYYVNRLLFSADGTHVISAGADSMIHYWNVTKPGTPAKDGAPLQGHPGEPWNMLFSPDGNLLQSNGEDGNLLIDIVEKKLLGRGYFTTSMDGNTLAYQVTNEATGMNLIHIINIETGKAIGDSLQGQNPNFSPDSNKIVYQTYDSSGMPRLHVRDVKSQRESKTINSGEYVAFSADSSLLVYRTMDMETGMPVLNLWDIAAAKIIGSPTSGSYLNISPSGKILIYQTSSAEEETQIVLWDIRNAVALKTIASEIVVVSQNGKVLEFTTLENGSQTINLLDTETGEPLIKPIENSNFITMSQNGKILLYSHLDEKNNQLLVALNTGTDEKIVSEIGWFNGATESGNLFAYNIWNNGEASIGLINTSTAQELGDPFKGYNPRLSSNGEILTFDVNEGNITKFNVRSITQNSSILGSIAGTIQFQDDRSLVYQTVEEDGNHVNLFDLTKRVTIGEPINGTYMALSPDGKILVTKSETNAVSFWNVTQAWSLGKQVGPEEGTISNAALSPDGKTLAFENEYGINLQNALNGTPLGRPFNGHAGRVNNVNFSPDKKILLTMGEDNKIIAWDLVTHTPLGTPLPGMYASFSLDGRLIAAGDTIKNTVTIWDSASWQLIGKPIPGSYSTFSPDGKFVAVSDPSDNTTTVWNSMTRNEISDGIPGQQVTFSPDGNIIIVSNWNVSPNTITLFDITSQQILMDSIQGYIVTSPALEDVFILADTANDTTTIWEWATQKPVSDPIQGSAPFLAGAKTNILVVRDSANNKTTFWDTTTRKQIGNALPGVNLISSPNGTLLSIADNNSNITIIWDVEKQEQLDRFTGQFTPTFCADNQTAAWFDASSPAIMVWTEGESISEIKLDERSKDYGYAGISFSPDCSILAIGQYWDNKTRFWNVSKKEDIGKAINGPYTVFSPNGSNVLVQDGNRGTVAFWNIVDGTQVGEEIKGNTGINISPDNPNIAAIVNYEYSNGSYATTLWDLDNHTQIGDALNGSYFPVFGSDGELVIYDNKGVRFLEVEQNRIIGEPLRGHAAPSTSMLFGPDGRILASLASDGVVLTRLDTTVSNILLDTGKYLGQFNEMATSYVNMKTMAFSTDGKTFTVLSKDGAIFIWDIAGDPPVLRDHVDAPYKDFMGNVPRLGLSPDGGYVVYESSQKLIVTEIANPQEAVQEIELKICCGGQVAFSPDGKSVFYSDGGTIFQWDEWNNHATTAKSQRLFSTGSTNGIVSLNVIADAQKPIYILVGYYDQNYVLHTQIWDLTTGSKVGDSITGTVKVFGSSAQSQTMIYSINDRLLNLDLNPTNWIKTLCGKANRNLARKEWEQYIAEAGEYEAVCPGFEIEP